MSLLFKARQRASPSDERNSNAPSFSLVNKDTARHLNEEARRKLELDLAATSLWELVATGTATGRDYKEAPIKD